MSEKLESDVTLSNEQAEQVAGGIEIRIDNLVEPEKVPGGNSILLPDRDFSPYETRKTL